MTPENTGKIAVIGESCKLGYLVYFDTGTDHLLCNFHPTGCKMVHKGLSDIFLEQPTEITSTL
jgi:hypothetical protein